jgi:hypothetical protein
MTLTEQQIADGWKPHDGGPCPVPLDSKPEVLCRDGYIYDATFKARQYGGLWRSKHTQASRGIIAYREVDNGN